MKKNLIIFICFLLFICGCSAKNSKNDITLDNIDTQQHDDKKGSDNVITVWEDKNFEALIRFYLNNFDKDIYIKDLDDITELNIQSNSSVITNIKECEIPEEYQNKIDLITSMKDIDNFNNLNKIAITANKINSIYTYKNSSSISFLDLSLNKLRDLSGIENYSNLTNFDFTDNYIENLKPLNNLTKLISLNLSNIGPPADNIDGCYSSNIDIDVISELTNLESLDIINSNINNISSLNKLKNLKNIILYRCNLNIDELYLISDNKENKIESLHLGISNISGEPVILDLSKFKNLNNIKKLIVWGESKNIGSLKSINSLTIHNAFISKNENLSNLKNIKKLTILDSQFEDIKILEGITSLENIDFRGTEIDSLKYLENNKNLKFITVILGNLNDISDLKAFTDIENVIIPNNNIEDVSVFSNLQKLKKLDIANNPIIDYEVIENLKNNKEMQIVQ